jgi:hypothetical protein
MENPLKTMQTLHGPRGGCLSKAGGRKKTRQWRVALEARGNQAMKTAMKANKKIKTAPATGITMGMCLTTPSTGSSDACESL